MKKSELEQLAFDYPNDFDFGGIMRQIIPSLEEKEEVTKETTNWKELYARLAADFDNFRKRTAKEREELVLKTKLSMLETLLDIDSDISLALNAIKDEESKKGLNLITSKLDKFLTSHGVETIPTDKYYPEKHEVVSVLTEGSTDIAGVISKGYSIGEKIVRYPKVVLK